MSTSINYHQTKLRVIIGKEGRNIKAFADRRPGVEVIVDDTPGAIIPISLSTPTEDKSYGVAHENLIADGRIQPAKD